MVQATFLIKIYFFSKEMVVKLSAAFAILHFDMCALRFWGSSEPWCKYGTGICTRLTQLRRKGGSKGYLVNFFPNLIQKGGLWKKCSCILHTPSCRNAFCLKTHPCVLMHCRHHVSYFRPEEEIVGRKHIFPNVEVT